ncbi:MAG: hypothetical protein IKU16_04030 [Muribaculaceae bacterium]|nr:hypothetical protein [Muribaculaceae bacterium]
MYRILLLTMLAAFLMGCTSKQENQTLEEYNQMFEQVITLEKQISQTDFHTLSGEELAEMNEMGKELYYDYNPMGLTPEQVSSCEALKVRVNKLRNDLITLTANEIKNCKVTPWNYDELLLSQSQTYPVYLQKGEKLYWNITASKPIAVQLCNADSRSVLKKYKGKSVVNDSLVVENTAIYYIEINPQGTQYVGLEISYKVNDMSRLGNATPVKVDNIECGKADLGAKSVSGISMIKCFDEPRKFTLRGQLKAAFSGSSKALVAVQIPAGATDILYSMRIATSEHDSSSDGEFHENLTTSYEEVKFLGLPLYEKEKNGDVNLFSKLLDDNRPLREEDAYCNMYVFRSQTQAKQFQDGTKSASVLNYDVDYSTLGTQSCNGRIPVKGQKTIYLAFENERIRYTNYLWVEVEAVVPKTEYFTTKYSIE